MALNFRAAHRLQNGAFQPIQECLVVEEPLEIRLDGRRYSATMRTPGDDFLLVQGLLLAEGIIQNLDDIERLESQTRCRENGSELVNIVNAILHDHSQIPAQLWERSLISNASCGLCGKASIEAMAVRVAPLPASPIPVDILPTLPAKMREKQKWFTQTGGLHAAAIFSCNGELLACFEDIGRHNATDKAIGFGLEDGWIPAREPLVLLVSGRASFEIVQKAIVARIATLAAVSAVSSLAVDLAEANNLNLVGFLRGENATVYCGQEEISRDIAQRQGHSVLEAGSRIGRVF